MTPEEILTAQFHAQLIRLTESGLALVEFLSLPSEVLAEETMAVLRSKVRTDRRANR